MDDQSLKNKPAELIQAQKLIDEARFEEAIQLMDVFKENAEDSRHAQLSCNLLKSEILIEQGSYEDAIKLSDQTYREALELGERLLAFDALNKLCMSLFWLFRLDEGLEKIKECEELLETLTRILPIEYKQRRAAIEYHKAGFYVYHNDANNAEVHGKLGMAMLEEIGDDRALAVFLISSTFLYANLKGEIDLAFDNIEKGLAILKKINWKYWIAIGLLNKGTVYAFKGDIDHSIMYQEQCLTIFREINNKRFMASALNNLALNYRIKGDLDLALESLEQGLLMSRELGNLRNVAISQVNIIEFSIQKGDLERARQNLTQLEQIKDQLKDVQVDLWYRFNMALLLKTSLRAPSRGESEVILKQILAEQVDNYEINVGVLLNLCELLLIELRMLNDLEVLEELESFIGQLLNISEKSHSYILLAETYYLKAKISLLTLDMKEARRYLTQAQRIAERWGLNQLATKISLEHDKLRNQLSMWEGLKEEEVSLSERMKLAGMDEQMGHLLRNRASLATQVKEEQITVHKERKICLICKGDILGFMYACRCDVLYCEKCARALTEIENACWACNAQIDNKKPIKPYKEEVVGKKDSVKEPHKKLKDYDNGLKK